MRYFLDFSFDLASSAVVELDGDFLPVSFCASGEDRPESCWANGDILPASVGVVCAKAGSVSRTVPVNRLIGKSAFMRSSFDGV